MRLISTVINVDNIPRKSIVGHMKTLDLRFMQDLLEDVRVVHVIKIFQGPGNEYLDAFKTTEWIKHIQPARDHSEINIELVPDYEEGGNVFILQASKDIPSHSTLKVWFSDICMMQLHIPFLTSTNIISKCPTIFKLFICIPQIDAWLYRCHLCAFKTPFPNILKAHLCLYNHLTNTHRAYFDSLVKLHHDLLDELPKSIIPSSIQELPHTPSIKSYPKMHRCFFCGKLYSRKYGLKIHIRTHTGYKPLSCKICRRPFGDPSNLNKHIRLHTQTTNQYQCEICHKNLLRRRDLERHYKTQHDASEKKSLFI